MGLRYRKSIKLFPGVRLNLSGGRISTTIGVPGASLNLGLDGRAHMTLGVPGSGLSYRANLTPPRQAPRLSDQPPLPGSPSRTPFPPAAVPGEIRSAAVRSLTSPALADLKRLVNEAADRRRRLEVEIAGRERDLARARAWMRLAKLFVIRLLAWRAIPGIEERVGVARIELEALRKELEMTALEMDFDFDEDVLGLFRELGNAHDRASGSGRVWDITSAVATDMYRERTIARTSVRRTPVALHRARHNSVQARWEALRFGNANGDPLLLYPGFLLVRDRGGDFALVDVADLEVQANITEFIEDETVPRDAPVVGRTWLKANKDGSRDKRFAANRQLPIVRYGKIHLRSRTGLNEAYMVSDPDAALAFGAAFERYQRTLTGRLKGRAAPTSPVQPAAEAMPMEAELELEGVVEGDAPSRRRLISLVPDVAFLLLLASGAAAWSTWPGLRPSTGLAAPSSASRPVAEQRPEPAAPSVLPPAVSDRFTIGAVQGSVDASAGKVFAVRVKSANVRSGPAADASVVRTLKRGDRLSVVARQGQWFQLGDSGPSEWVHDSVVEAVQ